MNQKLYIKLRHRVKIDKQDPVYLEDVCQFIADQPQQEADLKKMKVYDFKPGQGNIVIMDVMQILRLIRDHYPDLEIEIHGPSQTIIEIVTSRNHTNWVLVCFVCLILFVGSGLALMNFHEDVSMREVRQKIYYLITGEVSEYPLLLQIPYSIGIGLGIIMFFNQLFRKKMSDEPSPLEVEMFNYQQSLDQYVIMNENDENRRNKHDHV